MSGTVHNLDQEYWQPPVQTQPPGLAAVNMELCPRCSSEFVVGARFCHVCGTEREPQPGSSGSSLAHALDFRSLREALGMTIGALVAFIAGIACIVAAVVTGFIYSATTMLDWQAVQVWRIEWLLAAAVAFIGGILLNRAR